MMYIKQEKFLIRQQPTVVVAVVYGCVVCCYVGIRTAIVCPLSQQAEVVVFLEAQYVISETSQQQCPSSMCHCDAWCVIKFEQIRQMFHIRVVMPGQEDIYLPTDVDLPLYITAVDE